MPSGTDSGARRGRPPAFDKAIVAGSIVDTFWTRGFSATSLDHLTEATGLHRPSLYAAFGNKKDMYREALRLFSDQLQAEIAVTLSLGDATKSLTAFYRSAIEVYTGGESSPRGCLFVCTAAVESVVDGDVRKDLAGVLQQIDRALIDRFKIAQQAGEIADGKDPKLLGTMAASVLHSIAVRARAGQSKASLRRLADAAVAELLEPA